MDDQEANAVPAETQAPSGYCIEIKVGADRRITVSVEPEQAETEEGAEDTGSPVGNFAEALQVAQDIYKNGGQVADAAAEDADFASGFATGPKMPQGPAKRFA